MSFTSPLLLTLFLPWLAAAIWLLSARGADAVVPFVHLWPRDHPSAGPTRRLRRLPLWIILLLMASAGGILSAAGPVLAREPTPVVSIHPPNVKISHAAAVDRPAPEIMARLHSEGWSGIATIHAKSGEVSAEVAATVSAGEERDFFLTLPSFSDRIEIQVAADDAVAQDNSATLIRTSTPPRVEARSPLPSDVSRIIDVYNRLRPASVGAAAVSVLKQDGSRATADSAVFIHADSGKSESLADGPIVLAGPIGRNVDWHAALREASIGPEPDSSWQPLVRVAGRTIVAERSSPQRQVLVNFQSPAFAREPGFVVLFTDIFDSFAAMQAEWTFQPQPNQRAESTGATSTTLHLAGYLTIASLALLALGVGMARLDTPSVRS